MSKKSVEYPACEKHFGINIIHACSSVISKANVEPCLRAHIFKRRVGSGRHKRETDERMDRHYGLHYIIDNTLGLKIYIYIYIFHHGYFVDPTRDCYS